MDDYIEKNQDVSDQFGEAAELKASVEDMAEELAVADSIVITNVSTPEDMRPDSNNLVGYMTNLSIDPDTHAVSGHIIQGRSQYHAWLLSAYEAQKTNTIDTMVRQPQDVPGQVRFSADSFHSRLNFELYVDDFDPHITDTVVAFLRGLLTSADIDISAVGNYKLKIKIHMPGDPSQTDDEFPQTQDIGTVERLGDYLVGDQLDTEKLKVLLS